MGSRDEIAGCSERAYASLSVADAERLLLFPSKKEVLDYAAEVWLQLQLLFFMMHAQPAVS